jgi:hypothetical protein
VAGVYVGLEHALEAPTVRGQSAANT